MPTRHLTDAQRQGFARFDGEPAPDQLALEPTTSMEAYFEGSRRIRHLALIRTHCGFTDFGDNPVARFRLTRWLYALCWSGDDRPGPLIDRAAAWLIANKVLLPGVTVVGDWSGESAIVREPGSGAIWSPA